jgi:dCTP deaminase
VSAQDLPTPTAADEPSAVGPGVLPSQGLHRALDEGWISAGVYNVPEQNVQPASLDLRLGREVWRLQCSFLPDRRSTVRERADELQLDKFDIHARDGATLELDRPYLIPLVESLRLPSSIRGKANPKSSTGRLDVFTRVITDFNNRFDEIAPGYHGELYLEVVPRSYTVRVEELLSLNQLRLAAGTPRVSDEELRAIHDETPLLYLGSDPVAGEDLTVSEGLFLSVDLLGDSNEIVGYRAKRNSRRLDLSMVRHYHWRDFWEPVFPDDKGRVILEPEVFYLLLSSEGVSVPPGYASEMMAYDPTAGELRTHYAGFFDPGFGYSRSGEIRGSRAALEVRARDVPFMIEHGQPICKLGFERMLEEPDRLYGEDVNSNYQGQETMLSKHFTPALRD